MHALIVFVALDYLTGVIVAIIEKKLSSEIGFKGILKKVLIFVLVGIGNMVDTLLLKNGSAVRTAVIFFYLSNEGISILENCSKAGLPIPDKLKAVLEQFNKAESSEGQQCPSFFVSGMFDTVFYAQSAYIKHILYACTLPTTICSVLILEI